MEKQADLPVESDTPEEATESFADHMEAVFEPPKDEAETEPPLAPLEAEDGAEEETAQAPVDGEEPPAEATGEETAQEEPAPSDADGADDEPDVGELTDEELNKFERRDFKKRVQSAVRQRHREKAQREELQTQVDQLTQMMGAQSLEEIAPQMQRMAADAKVAQDFGQYMQQNNLASQDVQMLLKTGSAIAKGDWQQAHQLMSPYIEIMNQQLGLGLPADLRQGVQEGKYDEDVAKELAVSRAREAQASIQARRASTNAQQTQQTVQAQQSAAQQHAARQHTQGIKTAMDQWTGAQARVDPDFDKKLPFIRDALRARAADQGSPPSADVAKQWAEEALTRVNGQFQPAPVSPRKPDAPIPSGSGKPAAQQPQSLREAVDLALKGG